MASFMTSLKEYPELCLLRDLVRRKKLKTWLVGGFLRDLFLEREGHDFDFAVEKDAVRLARAFAKKVHGAFVLLDEEHGCARVARKKAGRLWTFDFADLRARTLRADLIKRDFTVNTFALDLSALSLDEPFTGAVLRNTRARADLATGTLRMASVRAFKDDPLRLLRAYSLAAQLGFTIDPATKKAVKAQTSLIREVSPERVREELFKILESPRAAATLKTMDKDGMLFTIIPQLRVMEKVHQGVYHHLDVWRHSLEVVKQLEKLLEELKDDPDLAVYLNEEIAGGHSRKAVIKLACLLHDIGKPDTRKKEPGGRTSFHGHEHVGRRISRIVARNLMLSSRERYALEDMVTCHLRPGYLSNFKKPSERAVFRFFRDVKEEAVATLLLSMADQRSTRGPLTTDYDVKHHEQIAFPLMAAYFHKRKEKPLVRLVTGHDLIKVLKMKPGPQFAGILGAVEEAQHLGKVATKEEALLLARKMAGEGKS